MGRVPSRGALTDLLLGWLRDGGAFPVGDGIAPREGGWSGGQPGSGTFAAYAVLGVSAGTPNLTEPVGDTNSSWSMGYTLRGVGMARGQAEWVCDQTRGMLADLLDGVKYVDLDGRWRLQRVVFSALGAVTRNDSVDPPYWECQDVFALWLDRSRT